MALNHYSPAPSRQLLIDENYVKSIADLDANVDPRLIRPLIMMSQDKWLLPILGSGVLGEIQAQISAGTLSNYTANTLVYLNFIQPCLAFFTMYELVPFMGMRLQEKGVVIKNSKNSRSANVDELEYRREPYKDMGMFYGQRLSQFLKENQDLYPLYYNPGSGIDVYYANSTSYDGGIFIPRTGYNGSSGFNPLGWGLTTTDIDSFRGFFGNI